MSQKIEGTQQKILGNDTSSTLNFITTKPVTDHSLVIPSVMRFSANSTLQPQIIQLVNDARVGSGSNSVQESEFGSQVAQALALRMAATNQLSRTEIDGNTPFDLLDRGNISYTKVSFLSTHAQSMEIAIQGLMEIPQYNTQITSSQYTSIGAGVVSLNEHGYIVTLLFIQ
jgi:uncharacterized protein YkwD